MAPRKSRDLTAAEHAAISDQQMRLKFEQTHTPKPSRITHVSFRSSISGAAQYQHLHVEATAEVGANDDPTVVLDGLKVFVARELHRARFGRTQDPTDPSILSFEDIFKQAQRVRR